jgi:hypothetical protein
MMGRANVKRRLGWIVKARAWKAYSGLLNEEKFWREPGADDPIFSDPSKDTPQPMDDVAVGAAVRRQ